MKNVLMCMKLILISIVVASIASSICSAAEFSATQVMQCQDAKGKTLDGVTFYGKIYVKGNMERGEYYDRLLDAGEKKSQKSEASSKPDTVTIRIPNKGVSWHIKPHQRSYTENTDPVANVHYPPHGWKYICTEVINGYKCKKYTKSFDVDSQKSNDTLWWSIKLNYAIKTISKSKGDFETCELTNIVEKRLPNSLFQPPKGYKKVPYKDSKTTPSSK